MAGSYPDGKDACHTGWAGAIAQLGERRLCKPEGAGSSPAGSTRKLPAASRDLDIVFDLSRSEDILRSAYRAFNAREIDAAVALMHPSVDWPNAWEGGRVIGRSAVREYWTRQFAAISSHVEPEGFTAEADGSITVDVHQVARDAGTGELLSDSRVHHRYWLEDGLIVRMVVLEAPEQP